MTPGIPSVALPVAPAVEAPALPPQPPIPSVEDREFDVALEMAVAQLTPPEVRAPDVPAAPVVDEAAPPEAPVPIELDAPGVGSPADASWTPDAHPGGAGPETSATEAMHRALDRHLASLVRGRAHARPTASPPNAAPGVGSTVADAAQVAGAPSPVPPHATAVVPTLDSERRSNLRPAATTSADAAGQGAVAHDRAAAAPGANALEPLPTSPIAPGETDVTVLAMRSPRPAPGVARRDFGATVPARVPPASGAATADRADASAVPSAASDAAEARVVPTTRLGVHAPLPRELPRVEPSLLAAAAASAQVLEPEAPLEAGESGVTPADAKESAGQGDAKASAAPAVLGRWLEHVRAVLAKVARAAAPATEPHEPSRLPLAAHDATPASPARSAESWPQGVPATEAAPDAPAPMPTKAGSSAAASRVASGEDVPSAADDAAPEATSAPSFANPRTPAAGAAPVEFAPSSSPRTVEGGARVSGSSNVSDPGGMLEQVERAASAPTSGERVTLRFDGEGGVHGRIRLAVRGDALHATVVPVAGFEPAGDVSELRRLLVERGFAEAHVRMQEPATSAPSNAGGGQGQSPRDDARRESFARAHDERGRSESHGRPGRERPRHSQGDLS